jgi:hypothetical protein
MPLDALPPPPSPEIVIIVPDGLAANDKGHPLPIPSFVYRAVLDAAAQRKQARLLLAPANAFDTNTTEQEAGYYYLQDKNIKAEFAPTPAGSDYIDTCQNASLLRQWLEEKGEWPLPPVTLLVAFRHAARATFCFRANGFTLNIIAPVIYTIPDDEPIVGRLWYYRWPWVHEAYEFTALLFDILRYSTKNMR